jgi:hypothetical protein
MADGSPHPSQPFEVNAALPPSDPNLDNQALSEGSKLPSAAEKPSGVIKDSPLSQSAIPTSIHSDLDRVESMPAVTSVKPPKTPLVLLRSQLSPAAMFHP